jgi:MoaA/NifB/PqqE/SkfB family radical SAM enzyme
VLFRGKPIERHGDPDLIGAFARKTLKKAQRALRVGPPVVSLLELHVTHACNLACESCSHYSDHGHRGDLDPATADRWMAAWSGRIKVKQFNLLGGEPTMHPGLCEFVPLVRRHWPAAHIRVCTNGFFLNRHPKLPSVLAAAGNTDIWLSVHHDDGAYTERLRPVRDLLAGWQRDHGTTVHYRPAHAQWTRRYRGFGADMQPFEDGRPRESWEICPAKWCKQLHDGKIWKCAPLAYLGMQRARYDLSEKWNPYLGYQPLDPSCSDRELDQFLALEEEPVCSMCSAEPRRFTLPNPMRNAPKTSLPVQGATNEL